MALQSSANSLRPGDALERHGSSDLIMGERACAGVSQAAVTDQGDGRAIFRESKSSSSRVWSLASCGKLSHRCLTNIFASPLREPSAETVKEAEDLQ